MAFVQLSIMVMVLCWFLIPAYHFFGEGLDYRQGLALLFTSMVPGLNILVWIMLACATLIATFRLFFPKFPGKWEEF